MERGNITYFAQQLRIWVVYLLFKRKKKNNQAVEEFSKQRVLCVALGPDV